MNLREKHGKTQPLKGARIVGCLHMYDPFSFISLG